MTSFLVFGIYCTLKGRASLLQGFYFEYVFERSVESNLIEKNQEGDYYVSEGVSVEDMSCMLTLVGAQPQHQPQHISCDPKYILLVKYNVISKFLNTFIVRPSLGHDVEAAVTSFSGNVMLRIRYSESHSVTDDEFRGTAFIASIIIILNISSCNPGTCADAQPLNNKMSLKLESHVDWRILPISDTNHNSGSKLIKLETIYRTICEFNGTYLLFS